MPVLRSKARSQAHVYFSDPAHMIDARCVNSCFVFVDGKYSLKYSRTSNIPCNISWHVLAADNSFESRNGSASLAAELLPVPPPSPSPSEGGKGAMGRVLEELSHVPDRTELARNSYGSDWITALNMVWYSKFPVLSTPLDV
jgi:hypothetical protein